MNRVPIEVLITVPNSMLSPLLNKETLACAGSLALGLIIEEQPLEEVTHGSERFGRSDRSGGLFFAE